MLKPYYTNKYNKFTNEMTFTIIENKYLFNAIGFTSFTSKSIQLKGTDNNLLLLPNRI